MPEFITVVVEATGRKQRVPAHYLDHPVLSRGLRRPPSQAEAEKPAGTPDETPALSTTRVQEPGRQIGDQRRDPRRGHTTTDPDGTEPPAETPPAGD